MLTFCLEIVVYSGLTPCGDNHTFSCIFDDCENGFTMPNGAIVVNTALTSSYGNNDGNNYDHNSIFLNSAA